MNKVIDLKGSVLSITLLKLFSDDIEEIKESIKEKVKTSSSFFNNIPVLLEPEVNFNDSTYLAILVDFLYQQKMIPVGIRTEDAKIIEQAEYTGLAIFPKNKVSKLLEDKPIEDLDVKTAMLVENTVRSGQEVYAKNRDLIVMGSVNPGAEIMADGHVHVFGNIMGRVFAGIRGKKNARIFAKNFNPELACIAGIYMLNEDIQESHKTDFVEVSLKEEKFIFKKGLMV